MQLNSLPYSATSTYLPARSVVKNPQPKFGAVGGIIGGSALNEVVKSLTSNDKKEGKKLRRFLLKKVLPTALLTTAFMNVQSLVKVERQFCNKHGETAVMADIPGLEKLPMACDGHEEGQSLQSVFDDPKLADQEFTTPLEDILAFAQSKQVDLDAEDLRDLAKAGAVREIVSTNPTEAKVTAVLLDGSEVKVSIDNTLREEIVRDYDIPIDTPPLQWAKFDLVMAGLYASATIAAFSGAGDSAKRLKRRLDKHPDFVQNKKTLAAYETGFYIAAKELDLLEKHSVFKRAAKTLRLKHFGNKRITLEDVEEIYERLYNEVQSLDYTNPKSLNTDAINEMRQWIRVYLAGVWAEYYLIDDNKDLDPSIVERRVAEKVSAGARMMSSKGADDNSVEWRYVKEAPDKAKIEVVAQKIFEEELLKAQQIIAQYPDQLIELYDAFSNVKRLKKSEAEKIFGGATIEHIKKDRKGLLNLFKN